MLHAVLKNIRLREREIRGRLSRDLKVMWECWGRSLPGRRNSKCKGPDEEVIESE